MGWFYCNRFLIKDPKLKNAFDDYITYIIIGIIIGGRLGYVIIYNFKYYINNPLEILMIWNGGMSFHGALIGIIIVTIIFCKNRDSSPFTFRLSCCNSSIEFFLEEFLILLIQNSLEEKQM